MDRRGTLRWSVISAAHHDVALLRDGTAGDDRSARVGQCYRTMVEARSPCAPPVWGADSESIPDRRFARRRELGQQGLARAFESQQEAPACCSPHWMHSCAGTTPGEDDGRFVPCGWPDKTAEGSHLREKPSGTHRRWLHPMRIRARARSTGALKRLVERGLVPTCRRHPFGCEHALGRVECVGREAAQKALRCSAARTGAGQMLAPDPAVMRR